MELLEKLKTKLTLLKLKNIVKEEYKKDYYEDDKNIDYIVHIKEPEKKEDGYTYFENLIIYKNGMMIFDNYKLKLTNAEHSDLYNESNKVLRKSK